MRVSFLLQTLGNILQAELMDGGKCLMHNKVGPYVFFQRERGLNRGRGGRVASMHSLSCSHNLINDESISVSFQNVGKTAQPCLPVTS